MIILNSKINKRNSASVINSHGVLGFLVFGYWVVQKNFFFVFLYEKNLGGSYEVAFIPALWMVSSESLKRLYPN